MDNIQESLVLHESEMSAELVSSEQFCPHYGLSEFASLERTTLYPNTGNTLCLTRIGMSMEQQNPVSKSPGIPGELWAAYESTTFVAECVGRRVHIRIDRHCAGLDELLKQNDHHSWAFITAHNPGSVILTPQENAQRHSALIETVSNGTWLIYEGEGIGSDNDWLPEKSLLVLGIEERKAVLLGGQFGQHAIVTGVLGGKAQLLVCEQ